MGESIVYAIKCALVVAAAALFLVATATLFSIVVQFGSFSLVGQVFGIISMCLPFNALTVFTSMFAAFDAIIAWVLARKLYSMNRKGVEST